MSGLTKKPLRGHYLHLTGSCPFDFDVAKMAKLGQFIEWTLRITLKVLLLVERRGCGDTCFAMKQEIVL